jgi:hypothetical protein
MAKHLFLDLEDTIITPVMNGWFNTELINLQKIRKVIAEFQPDQVHVFSFAIWNERELKGFNDGTRRMIEEALGVKLIMVPAVDDQIIPACCSILKIAASTVDFSDASAFWGKHEAFRLFARSTFKYTWAAWEIDTHVLLLDDAVFDEKFEWPDLHITGEIRNIDAMAG